MMRGLVLEEIGPPENLKIESRQAPTPGDGEVLIKVELAGLIFADSEARRGTYFSPTIVPWRPGREAAGTIAAVGPNVKGLTLGQRVAALVLTGFASEPNTSWPRRRWTRRRPLRRRSCPCLMTRLLGPGARPSG